MPIYEYRCCSCDHKFELRRKFGEDSGAPCPNCSGEGKRVFSAVPIIFKGSGFYVTDSRAKNSAAESGNGAATETPKEESKEAAPKPEAKTDAKSES